MEANWDRIDSSVKVKAEGQGQGQGHGPKDPGSCDCSLYNTRESDDNYLLEK